MMKLFAPEVKVTLPSNRKKLSTRGTLYSGPGLAGPNKMQQKCTRVRCCNNCNGNTQIDAKGLKPLFWRENFRVDKQYFYWRTTFTARTIFFYKRSSLYPTANTCQRALLPLSLQILSNAWSHVKVKSFLKKSIP